MAAGTPAGTPPVSATTASGDGGNVPLVVSADDARSMKELLDYFRHMQSTSTPPPPQQTYEQGGLSVVSALVEEKCFRLAEVSAQVQEKQRILAELDAKIEERGVCLQTSERWQKCLDDQRKALDVHEESLKMLRSGFESLVVELSGKEVSFF